VSLREDACVSMAGCAMNLSVAGHYLEPPMTSAPATRGPRAEAGGAVLLHKLQQPFGVKSTTIGVGSQP